MPNPVVIEFLMKGLPQIQAGMRNVEDSVARSERNATRLAEREAKARQRVAQQEARDKVRAMLKADAESRRAHQRGQREAEQAAKSQIRADERAAQAKVRAEDRAARQIAQIRERSATMAGRYAAKQANDQMRASAQWVKRREREQRIEQTEAYHNRRRFIQHVGGAAAQGVAAGAGRVANMAMQTAGMVSQLGGGFSLGDSVQRTVALRGKLADIANTSLIAGDPENSKRRSVGELEGAVRGVGIQYGIGGEEATGALDKFASKTGNLQRGLELLKGLAELSRAGAGSLDDLADAAGDIFNADEKQSAEDVMNTLRVVAIQGQKGAVEMKDLATQMAKLGAAAGRFEGNSGQNIATMGALAQLARQGGGAASAQQATTSVQSLTNQFYKSARLSGFKSLGVDVKTSEGFNRNIEDVLVETMLGAEKKSRANGGGLKDFDVLMAGAIADAQARRATLSLEKTFKQAGGGQTGADAVRARLAEFGSGGRDLKTEFSGKANERMREVDAQMAITQQKFDEAVSTRIIPKLLELMPVLEKLIPDFVDLAAKGIPAFVDLIKTVSDFAQKNKWLISTIASHPIGAIMAAEVTKSLAVANIGELFKRLIQAAMGPPPGVIPGGGAGVPGGGTGVGRGASAVASVAAVAALAYTGASAMDSMSNTTAGGMFGGQDRAANLAAKLRAFQEGDTTRGMSPEAVQREVTAAQLRLKGKGVISQTAALAGSFFSDESKKEYQQVRADQELVDSKELQRQLAETTAALRELSGATRASAAAGAGKPNGSGYPALDQSIVQRN